VPSLSWLFSVVNHAHTSGSTWEGELGTDRGRLSHRNHFARKIDPIVNGISDMESFKPVDKITSTVPTVVMLSNVQFIKDIKTSILAADIIINKFRFSEYRLLIYGAQDRQPAYAIEMAKLIAACNLSEHVSLAGFGSPREVLRNAWLFMNSSISEGLPLAIGEAALAGVPIVATEVGSTALVLTDPDDATQRYGEVVPPNDPMALARAQINILAMVGPWCRFTTDAPGGGGDEPSSASRPRSSRAVSQRASRHAVVLPDVITPEDAARLTRRMHERADDRRRLGLRAREVVLRSFHGARYLREHEQMYWVQWHLARMRGEAAHAGASRGLRGMPSLPTLQHVGRGQMDRGGNGDKEGKKTSHIRQSVVRWQDFAPKKKRQTKRLRKSLRAGDSVV
jgi:hypothetical protein